MDIPSPPEFIIKAEEKKEATLAMPKTVDYQLYQNAVDDRKNAEIAYAEIYTQYLDAITLHEKLHNKIAFFKKYRERVRKVYNYAKMGDQLLAQNLKTIESHLLATEKAMSRLQIENETLKISLNAHEEAFKNVTSKLGLAEATMDQANKQFRLLAEEFEKRGQEIDNHEKKTRGHIAQIEQLSSSVKDLHQKNENLRDENILLQNKLREVQIQEAGVSTLNVELTESMTKLQKQVHEVEEKLRYQKERSQNEIRELTEELQRLRNTKDAEYLVERSKQLQQNIYPQPQETVKIAAPTPLMNKDEIHHFLNRWSKIIDEISTQSVSLKTNKKKQNDRIEQLISERGELEIL